MANVTDPLAANLHGTDPQNLMEYITRQKIYDSRYWKEECFGLTAVDVLEKANSLVCVGGSYGGNAKPTKFLSLILKLLQIAPDDDLVDELISQDNFKYVRCLGAFYKRLSGRPADVYESLEPLYRDYRKLRVREVSDWKLLHVDEFVHTLFTEERVCGISLPRLPSRAVLIGAGYLEDGPRHTALVDVMEEHGGPKMYLKTKIEQGSVAAQELWEQRQNCQGSLLPSSINSMPQQQEEPSSKRPRAFDHKSRENDSATPISDGNCNSHNERKRQRDASRSSSKKYGSLFKQSTSSQEQLVHRSAFKPENDAEHKMQPDVRPRPPPQEGSEEYWNEERAKLGLKPLNK